MMADLGFNFYKYIYVYHEHNFFMTQNHLCKKICMLKKAYVQMFVKLAIYTKFDICTFAYKFLQGLL